MSFTTTIKNNLTSTDTLLYTSPASTTTILFSGTVSNKSTSVSCFLTLTFVSGITTIYIMNNVEIPVGSTLILPKKVIPAGTSLKAKTDTNSSGNADVSLELLTA